MKQNSIFSDAWCNLVFEGRNQKYGACLIRRNADYYTIFAFLISTTIVLSTLFLFVILRPSPAQHHHLSDLMDKVHLFDPDLPPVPIPETIKNAGSLKPAVKQEKESIPVIRDHVEPIPNMEVKNLIVGSQVNNFVNGDSLIPESLNESMVPDRDTTEENDRIYLNAGLETNPEFPGGEEGMMTFIKKNITYPGEAYRNGSSGTVYLSFVINKSGVVSDVEVLRGVKHEPAFETEAIRVIKLMPGWKPGRQNGKPVSVRYMLPVNFILKNSY